VLLLHLVDSNSSFVGRF